MNRVFATLQCTNDAGKARFRDGAALKCASRNEATAHRREDNRVKQLQVFGIEGTVYKNRSGRIQRQRTLPETRTSHLLGSCLDVNRRLIRCFPAKLFGSSADFIEPLLASAAALATDVMCSLVAKRPQRIENVASPRRWLFIGIHSERNPIAKERRRFSLTKDHREQPLIVVAPGASKRGAPFRFLPGSASATGTYENEKPDRTPDSAIQLVSPALSWSQILKIDPGFDSLAL
jgi:hypothetical protein